MFRRILLWLVVTMIMAAMVLATAVPAFAAQPAGWGTPFSPTPFPTAKTCHDSVPSHPDYCRPFWN